MAVRLSRLILLLLCMSVMIGCGVAHSEEVKKIALLAPFEGRYREIGYNALYAARLAINDSGHNHLDLIPMDDGSSVASAIDRARAFTHDTDVERALLIGPYATQPSVQAAFDDLPVLIIGYWTDEIATNNAYLLANPALEELLTVPVIPDLTDMISQPAPLTGSIFYSLEQVRKLRPSMADVTIISSSTLPAEDFRSRYIESDIFVPEPNLLATLVYDAAALTVNSLTTGVAYADIRYEGINGLITFDDQIWQSAPLYRYQDNDGILRATGADD